MTRLGRVSVLLSCALFGSCGESTAEGEGIGPAGGTIALAEGASIELPPGAVPDGVRVRAEVRQEAPSPPDGLSLNGKVYVFTPHGTQFAKPALIRIPVKAARGKPFALDNEQDDSWDEVPDASVQRGFHELSVSHISLFAELTPDDESGGGGGAGPGEDGAAGLGGSGEGGAGNPSGGASEGGAAEQDGRAGFGGQGEPDLALTAGRLCVGSMHGCAIVGDASVACWGAGYSGQLGDGMVYEDEPQGIASAQLVPGIDSAVQIACHSDFTVALLRDGSVLSWGRGDSGQMGDNSFALANSVPRPGLVAAATQISTGGGHVCARLEDQTVTCWGRGDFGQLGGGAFAGPPGVGSPASVPEVTDVQAVQTGAYHTCVLLTDATVKCWGLNDYGQLGVPTIEKSATPIVVPGLENVVQLSAGGNHTCALLEGGSISCWGLGDLGQRGDGVFHAEFPANPTRSTVAGDDSYVRVQASAFHTCAMTSAGEARCWGGGSTGMLGDGFFHEAEPYGVAAPIAVLSLNKVTDISLGTDNTCAREGDEAIWCWGWGELGALGNGNLYPVPPDTFPPASERGAAVPQRVLGIP